MADSSRSTGSVLLSSGVLVFVGMLLEMATNFSSKIIVAKLLTPAQYGAIALGFTTLSFLVMFVMLGVDRGVARYLPRAETDSGKRAVVLVAFKTTLPLSILAGASLVVLAPFLAVDVFSDPSTEFVFRLVGIALPFSALIRVAIGTGQGLQTPFPKVLLQNFARPVTRLAAVLLVAAVGVSVAGVASAYLASFVITGLIASYYLVVRLPFSLRGGSRSRTRELLRFSFPLMIASTMAVQLGTIDTLVLGIKSDTASVGVYNVVFPLAQLLTLFNASFGFLVMPVISKFHSQNDDDSMRDVYQTVTKWVFIMTLPIFLMMLLFPETIIRRTFGAQYTGGALTLMILTAGFFVQGVTGPNGDTLTSIGNSKLIMILNGGVAILNIALNVVLVPRFGAVGAAIATATVYSLLNILFSVFLYRNAKILPDFAALVPPAVLGAVTVVGVYAIDRIFALEFFAAAVVMTVFLGAYGVVILRYSVGKMEKGVIDDIGRERGIDVAAVQQFIQYFQS
ncbi:flippase (plasmid) [Haladaptatus sp. SPP-AMP-3]|uniref:flippase n=1 Tax=Haladaptatus sp. SPP-AMP-3 TaxID=3121295 RepID=UPI003C2D2CBA